MVIGIHGGGFKIFEEGAGGGVHAGEEFGERQLRADDADFDADLNEAGAAEVGEEFEKLPVVLRGLGDDKDAVEFAEGGDGGGGFVEGGGEGGRGLPRFGGDGGGEEVASWM